MQKSCKLLQTFFNKKTSLNFHFKRGWKYELINVIPALLYELYYWNGIYKNCVSYT